MYILLIIKNYLTPLEITMQKRRRIKQQNAEGQPVVKTPSRELVHQIFTIYNANPELSFSAKQITRRLATTDIETSVTQAQCAIEILFEDNVIKPREDKPGSFILTRTQNKTAVGKVDMTQSGIAYIIVEDAPQGAKDIIVESRRTMKAMHGDRVRVAIIGKRRDGRTEGEVVEILEKGKRKFVGTLIKSERFGFVEVDSKSLNKDIFVHIDNMKDAQDGDKVVVEIVDWPEDSKNPVGIILDVLGSTGDNDTEMHAILAQYDLPYSFPDRLENLAANIDSDLNEIEFAKRRDMRTVPTFTIDPADAKDFDDALSIQRLENGNWEVGVHIADVTHYVKEGDEIDVEALQRATSVYLVDRTVPMLPEKLSNMLCSLRPHEEKLCFSAVFEITNEGDIETEWFGRTVIYSDHRFTYEDAQVIIEEGETNTHPLKEQVLTLNKLAVILRAERFRNGSIGFERDEAKFVLDEKGRPQSVYFKEMKASNQLIEEFMLLANRSVAAKIGDVKGRKKPKTFVYRIHDTPNEEKFTKFKTFITRFGYHLTATKGDAVAKQLTSLLQTVKGKAEENLVSTLAIRSMAKASYSTENIGHYGLAFNFYTHFTSPIRRYPDMMVHRLLARYLDGGSSVNAPEYEELCEYTSSREVLAAEAERSSIKYKMVEFMEDKIGSEWDGVISGVTDWGIYVEIEENKIEGMVALRDMADDFYAFDNETYAVIGHKSGRRFTLGDIVRIKIKRADLARKQLDFEMVGTIDFETRELNELPDSMPMDSPVAENVKFYEAVTKNKTKRNSNSKGNGKKRR